MNKIICFIITAVLILSACGKKEAPPSAEAPLSVTEESAATELVVHDKYLELVSSVDNKIAEVSKASGWGIHIFGDDYTHIENSKKCVSASVIKIYIMEYAYSLITRGELSEDSVISGRNLKSIVYDMITVSDNTSTNILIDYFGMENLNGFFKEQGYENTLLERRMLDFNARAEGRENYTSVSDVLSFLNKLYLNRTEFPYSAMLDILKNQKVKTKIPLLLPNEAVVANKTGELSDTENDIGIIFSEKGDYALVFMLQDVSDSSSARNLINNISLDIYEFLSENHDL